MSLILSSTTESPEEAGIPSTESIAPRPFPRARLGTGAAFLGAALFTVFTEALAAVFFAAGLEAFVVFDVLAAVFAVFFVVALTAVLAFAGLPGPLFAAGAALAALVEVPFAAVSFLVDFLPLESSLPVRPPTRFFTLFVFV